MEKQAYYVFPSEKHFLPIGLWHSNNEKYIIIERVLLLNTKHYG